MQLEKLDEDVISGWQPAASHRRPKPLATAGGRRLLDNFSLIFTECQPLQKK
jgi:hypothetical protein